MTTPHRPRSTTRRLRAIAVAAVGVFALALTACVGPSEPEPTPTPLPQYPAQADFATVLDPAEFVPAAETVDAEFTAAYTDEGAQLDVGKLLNGSQGGYFPMRNTRWFADHIPQLTEMGIQQVRLDHVLNDHFYGVVNQQADGSVTYDFSRLDQTILPLLEQGIQPFIALSYTPGYLAKSHLNPPRSLEGWAAAVTAIVSHYRDLGYTGWGWEAWNEPDGPHWTGTFEQYYDLYAATAVAVKAADPTARIGGATAAYLTSDGNISGNFINYISRHPEIPIDFFSVHSYSSDSWDVVEASKTMLAEAGLNLPVLITEWGLHPRMSDGPGYGSDSNSSPTGPAYIARRLAMGAESDVERIFYFAPVEGLVFTKPYNGDLGLITVDGHRKAIGNVFAMFADMGDTQIDVTATGTGTDNRNVSGFLAKDSENGSATLLVWNNTDKDVNAGVDLTGLPYADTNFRATQRVISSTQGNGFSDASTVVAPMYPSPNENSPVVSDVVHDPANSYSDEVVIPAYGVVSIELTETAEESGHVEVSSEPSSINLASPWFESVVSASSSIEDAAGGWGLASATDGRRYSVDVLPAPMRGFSSQHHPTEAAVESLSVDLGTVQPVDSVSLWPYTPRSQASAGFPVDAVIQGSVDGVEWGTLAALENYRDGVSVSGEQVFSFPVTEARYVRVETSRLGAISTATGTAYALQLAEMEVHRTGVPNGGFETATLDGWVADGAVEVTSAAAYSANNGAQLAPGASLTTEIRGLVPEKTYTVGAYLRMTDAASDLTLSAIRPESGAVSTSSVSTGWQHVWVTFTTGKNETFVSISLENPSTSEVGWVDDVTIMQVETPED